MDDMDKAKNVLIPKHGGSFSHTRLNVAGCTIGCPNIAEGSEASGTSKNSGLLRRLLNADKTLRKFVVCEKAISRDIESAFDKSVMSIITANPKRKILRG